MNHSETVVKTTKNMGTKKMAMKVEKSMPPITPVAME